MDVDRKLEDGQKVTPSLCYRKEYLQGKLVASLNSAHSCSFQACKQMVEVEMGLLKINPHQGCGVLWYVIPVSLTQMGSCLSTACGSYPGVPLFAEQCQR